MMLKSLQYPQPMVHILMDLTMHMLVLNRPQPCGRGLGLPACIQVSSVKSLLHVQVLISIFQDLRAITSIDVIGILPGIVILLKTFPMNLELETIAEPLGIHVLLHNPKLLVVSLDGWQSWLVSVQDH